MEAIEQELIFHKTTEGLQPFTEWVPSLGDRQASQRVFARLARVRAGNFGDSKPVGEAVSELRVPSGPGYRVYFGRDGASIVVLLCGGDMSSQSKDIENAKRYWSDYKERMKSHEQR